MTSSRKQANASEYQENEVMSNVELLKTTLGDTVLLWIQCTCHVSIMYISGYDVVLYQGCRSNPLVPCPLNIHLAPKKKTRWLVFNIWNCSTNTLNKYVL